MKKGFKFLLGILLLAAYELTLDGSGVGMKARWRKVKEWSKK